MIQIDLPTHNIAAPRLYPVKPTSLMVEKSVDFPITVEYMGTEPAPQDVTIELILNNAAIDAYNAYMDEKKYTGDKYEALPANMYTLPTSLSVVIPKGQRKVVVPITCNTTLFDDTKKYALAFTIKSVSAGTISANYSTGLYAITRNKFDGIYTLEVGSTMASSNTAVATGSIAGVADISLISETGDRLLFVPIWADGTKVVDLGNTTITGTAVSAAGNTTLKNTGTNKYDAATKTYTLNFQWLSKSTSDPTGTTTFTNTAVMILKYKGSRF
ncbi:MAG: DUF1735 domain-containing protein [Sphingobacteriaceae bacterium]|nr:DUF1735 domain-containing protein [Sphingobacteriaceae bacterium]